MEPTSGLRGQRSRPLTEGLIEGTCPFCPHITHRHYAPHTTATPARQRGPQSRSLGPALTGKRLCGLRRR